MAELDLAVYIHWPFCAHKCPYCDFNSHVREQIDGQAWQDAYLRSIDHYANMIDPKRKVTSIFFGGGTPSLMDPKITGAIIDKIHKRWSVSGDCEITLEANPTSVEIDKFVSFAAAGVNRVSVGVQALDDKVLKFLGRQHSAAEAVKAVETAATVFDRYSFDLMYARPQQTLDEWSAELEHALQYAQGHMSLYQLTIEKGTAFHTQHSRGDFVMPDPDMSADFYELTQDIMGQAGLPSYEVSNHAKAGEQSRHNLSYWLYKDYIGIGPGAHGRISVAGAAGTELEKHATREHKAPEAWLSMVQDKGCGEHPHEVLTPQQQITEALMMGLRLVDGLTISLSDSVSAQSVDMARVKTLCAEGLLIKDGEHLRATQEGILRLNSLLAYICA